MPLREFSDRGVRWRVWDVTPEKMHPSTAADGYLGEYQEGWLVFESESERRRLPRVPRGWEQLPDDELQWLLDAAQIVARRTPAAGSRQQASTPASPPASPQPLRPDEGRLTPPNPAEAIGGGLRRIFTDAASGHVVVVRVERLAPPVPSAAGGKVPSSPGAVLRFKTEDKRLFDLSQWPDDWERLPRERLAELFALAQRETAQREVERAVRPAELDAQPPSRRRSSDPHR